MPRALRLIAIQVRAAALLAMQYRLDFLIDGVLGIAWIAIPVVPLLVLFRDRTGVAGWTWSEALVVVGFFTALKGMIALFMQPSLLQVVEHVRKGTLDFVLLKPASALLMVSTSRMDFSALADVVAGLGLACWGAWRGGAEPGLGGVLAMLVLLALGCTVLWALHVIAVSMAFHFVKIDNLTHLIMSTFDAARWPSSVYRGAFGIAFTFVFPLALMTTWPALALLGRATPWYLATGAALAAAFVLIAQLTWRHSLRRYTSAGG